MSNTLTIESVLAEVNARNNGASACVTVKIWSGDPSPKDGVSIWDGVELYEGPNLSAAFSRYMSRFVIGSTPEETAISALEVLNAENPTAAQEEANYQNSL